MKLTELSTFFDDEKNRPNDKAFPSNYKGTFKKYIECNKNNDVELTDVYSNFNDFDAFIQFLHQSLAPTTVRNYLRCFKSTIGTNIITQEVGDIVDEFEKYIDAKCKEADKLANNARKIKTANVIVVDDDIPLDNSVEPIDNNVEDINDTESESEHADDEVNDDDGFDFDDVQPREAQDYERPSADAKYKDITEVNNTRTIKLLEHFKMECCKLKAMLECKNDEIAFLRRVILEKH